MLRNYKIKNVNFILIGSIMALSIIGIFVIGSANSEYQTKQILGLVLGIGIMTVIMLIDYEFILHFYKVYYVLTCVLLLLVLIFGDKSKGATRWIDVGIRFQPSELGKILLILFFAAYFMHKEDIINDRIELLKTIGLAAIPLVLILEEPDLSTTIVTFMIIATMLFVAGLSYKIVKTILLIAIPTFAIFFYAVTREGQKILNEYQGGRILAWLYPEKYPDKAYQQLNSIMAIGSGRFLGKGLFNDTAASVKNGNYISEPHTDFIFAVAGEEIGFVGSVTIILLLLVTIYQCLKIAKKARDTSGKLICVGMAALIGFQSFVNICVVTGLMPNTGLPLPFVSYGLTSLVTMYIGMGFVLNVGLQAKKFY